MKTENINLATCITVLEVVKKAIKNREYRHFTDSTRIYTGNRKYLSKASVFSDSVYCLDKEIDGYSIMLSHNRIETKYRSGKSVVVRYKDEKEGNILIRINPEYPDTIWVYF